MILTVDKAVPKDVLVQLAALPEINTAVEIVLE